MGFGKLDFEVLLLSLIILIRIIFSFFWVIKPMIFIFLLVTPYYHTIEVITLELLKWFYLNRNYSLS